METQKSGYGTQDSGEVQQQFLSFCPWVKLGWLMVFGLLWATQAWAYSGGTGEPNDPYQIATAEDLIALGQEPNDYNDCFILTADIDLSGYVFERAVIAPDLEDDTYSLFDGSQFCGSFDGQGHIINHLSIEGKHYLGLFGRCSSMAVISNLGLEEIDVNGVGHYVGGLVGRSSSGVITSCYSTGIVNGQGYVGGLIGSNKDGCITSSYSIGSVNGFYGNYVGGLVGQNSGTITLSYSTGTVSGDTFVGGLVGRNSGTIMSSYSTESVNGTGGVGGLVGRNGGAEGENSGTITMCYSIGAVNGYANVGGLVGINASEAGVYYDSTIKLSYCWGDVIGNGNVGGLVGLNRNIISSSYSLGMVASTTDYAGGLVGWDDGGLITSCFWNMETSGQSSSDGGIGLTTLEMKTVQTYINAGWDLVGESANGTCNYWQVQQGAYPSLAVFTDYVPCEPNGSGTQEDPYLLMDANELGSVWYRPKAYYCLGKDLDLVDIVWSMAVVPEFQGHFNGQGYVIRHLQINGAGDVALIGNCSSEASIFNLGLESVDVNGAGGNVGGLVGVNDGGLITSCYSTGSVQVIGDNWTSGGLLIGWNGGTVVSCYSTGFIGSTTGGVGGLIAINDGRIISSYTVATIAGSNICNGIEGGTSCFWDVKITGQAHRTGGTGITTGEMNTIQTYIDAGWDLVGETANGTCNYWLVEEGTYPCLAVFSGYVPYEPNGTGTRDNPYVIMDINELGTIWYRPMAHYRLGNDLDLNGIVWNVAVVPEFRGHFDGGGHEIRHLQINGREKLGLFGYCYRGTIDSIGLEAVDINGSGNIVGGLVGSNFSSIITSSYSSGSVNGRYFVGGLVGSSSSGKIISSYSSADVQGGSGYSYYVGGLVGHNGSTITSSYSTGSVMGGYCVGGLVGASGGGKIMSSYSTGTVRGYGDIGGLVGEIYRGTVKSSFWDIETSHQINSPVGIGLTTSEMMSPQVFSLNGWSTDTNWIMDAGQDYPRLFWQGTSGQRIPEPAMDWITGDGKVETPYQIESVGQFDLISKASLLAGKHFLLINDLDLAGFAWTRAVIPFFSGSFNGNRHTIYNLTIQGGGCLGLFGRLEHGGKVTSLGLEAVDITGTEGCVGALVGYNDGGIITSNYSTGSVSGDDSVGGLVGENNEGTVRLSYSSGTVNGDDDVGGLVGVNNEGTIMLSYSSGTINGDDGLGGLVGKNNKGSVTWSYSRGNVSGDTSVGGFVGRNASGAINLSYSTGLVSGYDYDIGGFVGSSYWGSTVTSCFWDIETSGLSYSDGGTGLTTAEMQDINTFLDAGWDFVGETANGTDDIWTMLEVDYPHLTWEF